MHLHIIIFFFIITYRYYNRIQLFRLLLGKIKREIEQAQLKLTKLHNALDLSSDVHNRLQLQNTVNNTKVL